MTLHWPHWSFKEFVGTVNTTSLASVINAFLWLLTGFWTLHAMEWVVDAPTTELSLLRVGALVALLPFHAAWCGYLTVRSGINVAQTAVKRSTDLDYVKTKGEVEARKVEAAAVVEAKKVEAAARVANGQPKSIVQVDQAENVNAGGADAAAQP